jgi:NADH-ubiquinone oxidoreductase chain 1
LDGLISSLMLGIKSCLLIFVFIWARASLPRIRFDQLMSYCWTVLLPIVIAFIILVPCVVYSLSLISTNFYLI